MNYVTTNIRLPEEDYLRLKNEAAIQRKSLSAVIRERVSSVPAVSHDEVQKMLVKLDARAFRNGKKFKKTNGVLIIRELRDNARW